jgi:hypothetical protein
MAIGSSSPTKLQIRLTSAVDSVRASLEPYRGWLEKMMAAPLSQTLTLEADCNPADAVAEELLCGLSVVAATKFMNSSWRALIESWEIPPDVSPRIAVSLQRERRSKEPPAAVWEPDWQDCPVAFEFRGLSHYVISVKVSLTFPPSEMSVFPPSASQHWFIAHREDTAKVLLLMQQVLGQTERYLQTASGRMQLQAKYDWNSVVLDPHVRRMVRTDFELFFEREEWFRQHNLPYRRGYLLWGSPGNGKSATIRVMAAHPHIQPYTLDLSDKDQKSHDVFHLFEKAAENTPALIIIEDLDRAFPMEGKRTQECTVGFETLLNCLDGVGSQDGVIVVATANDPTCLDPAILRRPGRFDRVVQFRNPNADLRRQYYQRLSSRLAGEQFETAIQNTEGFSFAQLREAYILGAQSAFEHGREITVVDVIEAIELQAVGAQDLKTSVVASGFVGHPQPSPRRT